MTQKRTNARTHERNTKQIRTVPANLWSTVTFIASNSILRPFLKKDHISSRDRELLSCLVQLIVLNIGSSLLDIGGGKLVVFCTRQWVTCQPEVASKTKNEKDAPPPSDHP